MDIKKPRGTNDFYGDKVILMRKIEDIVTQLCKSYGIDEIRTPMFESTELFVRGVGDTTDIVQKEMFTFEDRGGRSLTLKPEGTAGAARAFIESGLYSEAQPTKLYYITSCFRNERPQAGRYKQFHQFGVEFFGSYSASADAELISFMHEVLQRLNIKNTTLKINSLGGNECRIKYNNILKEYINNKLDCLCEDCQARSVKNPLRILDCKNPNCKEILADAPAVLDVLDEECKAHFNGLMSSLDAMGIKYEVDKSIVRGLDYYTRTVFEFVSNEIGSQGTICGGGRYDNLVKEVGGSNMGAVGFAMGIERIMLLLEAQKGNSVKANTPVIYIGSMGDAGSLKAQELAYKLRKEGINAQSDIVGRSIKAQMKYADKIGAKYNIVIGENEIETDVVNLKDMIEGGSVQIKISNLLEEIKNRLEEK